MHAERLRRQVVGANCPRERYNAASVLMDRIDRTDTHSYKGGLKDLERQLAKGKPVVKPPSKSSSVPFEDLDPSVLARRSSLRANASGLKKAPPDEELKGLFQVRPQPKKTRKPVSHPDDVLRFSAPEMMLMLSYGRQNAVLESVLVQQATLAWPKTTDNLWFRPTVVPKRKTKPKSVCMDLTPVSGNWEHQQEIVERLCASNDSKRTGSMPVAILHSCPIMDARASNKALKNSTTCPLFSSQEVAESLSMVIRGCATEPITYLLQRYANPPEGKIIRVVWKQGAVEGAVAWELLARVAKGAKKDTQDESTRSSNNNNNNNNNNGRSNKQNMLPPKPNLVI
jgi:hypothetical protein